MYPSYPVHCPPSLSLSFSCMCGMQFWRCVLEGMCTRFWMAFISHQFLPYYLERILSLNLNFPDFQLDGSQKATIIQYITNLSNSKTRVDNMLSSTQILNWCWYLNSGPHACNNHSYKMCHFPYLHSRSHTSHCHHSRIDTPERLILHLYWVRWRN